LSAKLVLRREKRISDNGKCPRCNSDIMHKALGENEEGWLRLSVPVVLIEPMTREMRVKCPQCKRFVAA